MWVGVRPQSVTQYVTYYELYHVIQIVSLSSTLDSTYHLEGVTIFKIHLNLCVSISWSTVVLHM